MKAENADAEHPFEDYYPTCKKIDTGLKASPVHSEILSTDYYDLNGKKLSSLQPGIMIRVEKTVDGKRYVTKIIK